MVLSIVQVAVCITVLLHMIHGRGAHTLTLASKHKKHNLVSRVRACVLLLENNYSNTIYIYIVYNLDILTVISN